jgi:hypothetical protein
MPSENTFHAWQHTYSPGHHVSPTEYEEIIAFCKSEYYYYAVKAEDKDGEGKVHVHFIGFKEQAKHAPETAKKDLRYGASRKSHILRPADGRFWKKCPQIAKCIENRNIGMIMCQLTSDIVIEYYNKETHLVTSHLPNDMCVIRPLLAESHNEKVENNDIINHCAKYQLMKYPMPATPQTVWEYLNCRWFELNDLKLTKQEIHQVALTRSILNMLNKTSLELPKVLERKPMDSKKRKQIDSDYQKLDILTRMNYELHHSK